MNPPIPVQLSQANIGTALAVIGSPISNNGRGLDYRITISNTGTGTLNNFVIQTQSENDANWTSWVGGSDFATSSANYNASILNTTVTPSQYPPQSLAPAGIAFVQFAPGAVGSIRFLASAASGTTTVNINGAGRLVSGN